MSSEKETAEEVEKEDSSPTTEEEHSQEEQKETMSLEELADLLMESAKQAENDEPSLENMRSLGLYGDVDEERISEVIAGLLTLHHLGKPRQTEEGEVIEEGKSIDMYISTYGGSADDMAALVDIMGVVKKDCPIRTT